MASDDIQTNLRLPADLKDRLLGSAAKNGRSLSAEVSLRLQESYEEGKRGVTEDVLREVFRDMAKQQEAERMAQVAVRDLLATYLVHMYDVLPAGWRDDEGFKVAYGLAKDLKTEGNPELESWLEKIVGRDESGPLKAGAAVLRRDSAIKRKLKPEQ